MHTIQWENEDLRTNVRWRLRVDSQMCLFFMCIFFSWVRNLLFFSQRFGSCNQVNILVCLWPTDRFFKRPKINMNESNWQNKIHIVFINGTRKNGRRKIVAGKMVPEEWSPKTGPQKTILQKLISVERMLGN